MTAIKDMDLVGPEGAELARYRVSGGERVLMGWMRSGGVEVTDRPTEGRARAYVVDRGIRDYEQLCAFVVDYVDVAERLDGCPMAEETLREAMERTEMDGVLALAARL